MSVGLGNQDFQIPFCADGGLTSWPGGISGSANFKSLDSQRLVDDTAGQLAALKYASLENLLF